MSRRHDYVVKQARYKKQLREDAAAAERREHIGRLLGATQALRAGTLTARTTRPLLDMDVMLEVLQPRTKP